MPNVIFPTINIDFRQYQNIQMQHLFEECVFFYINFLKDFLLHFTH